VTAVLDTTSHAAAETPDVPLASWPARAGAFAVDTALSTWLGLSGIGACRGSVGWVSMGWVRLRQSVR
jgi:hypothetical protein